MPAAPRTAPPWLFAATIFLGAFLLFAVQPLVGKYALPWFGGGPAVWTTCVLFFQLVLLAGYAYAHLSARFCTPRGQAVAHGLLLLAALALLPVAPAERWKPTTPDHPTTDILLLLGATVGVPYFVLSATGPLVQTWFARAHPGRSPYRLFAVSNAASLVALVGYPFVVEPNLTRHAQAVGWSALLVPFAILCAGCAVGAARAVTSPEEIAAPPSQTVGVRTRFIWFALAACASALMLATTNRICQQVAAIPFLWVGPLGIYLLSLVISFDGPRAYRPGLFRALLVLALVGAGWLLVVPPTTIGIRPQLAAYAAGLFVCCMVCHGEVYRLRPAARGLTGFYLTVAAGGAAGGAFVGVVAPLAFDDFVELQVALGALALLVAAVAFTDPASRLHRGRPAWAWGLVTAVLVALGGLLYAGAGSVPPGATLVARSRSFYGVLSVLDFDRGTPRALRMLSHGGIAHGLQFLDPDRRDLVTSYYGPRSGLGIALDQLAPAAGRRLGVVGLGAGSVAGLAHAGDVVRFYEIDPNCLRVARADFSFLADSPARVQVVLGDARLSLERELAHGEAQRFDLLAVDAFNGDAIPAHLLTAECVTTYLRHLRPGGVLALHVTNKHLDLLPVAARIAEHFNLRRAEISDPLSDEPAGTMSSDWVLLSASADVLDAPAVRAAAAQPPRAPIPRVRLWTDEDANLFGVLR